MMVGRPIPRALMLLLLPAFVAAGTLEERLLCSLRTAGQMSPEDAYRYLHQDSHDLLETAPIPLPVGFRVALTGARKAAEVVSTYPGGRDILAGTYGTYLAAPADLGRDPKRIFPAILRLADGARGEQGTRDQWLTMLHILEAAGFEEVVQPHPLLGIALLAARDGGVHARTEAALRGLVEVVRRLQGASCDPRVTFHRTALGVAAAVAEPKGSFWTLLMYGDRLVRSDHADPRDREVLAPAVDRAWRSDLVGGAAVLREAFEFLLRAGESRPPEGVPSGPCGPDSSQPCS